jgi:hypothetical protein
MAPNTSTRVGGVTARIPHQPRGTQMVLPVLSTQPNGDYCRPVDDTSGTPKRQRGPWAEYVTWAAARAGSVDELAARTELHRTTISGWKTGRKTADNATLKSIRAIAAAVGDDPRNALRAAGRAVADDTARTPTPGPPLAADLAAELEAINERIRAIGRLGLPPHEELKAIKTQTALADQFIARYQRAQHDGEAHSA